MPNNKKSAALIREATGWSLDRCKKFVRNQRRVAEARQYKRDQGVSWTSALVAIATAHAEFEKEQQG